LNRHFKDETGTSPLRWLISERIRLARELLETTRLSVDEVADQVGFGSAVGLRQHFVRAVGAPPAAYRRTFHELSA
jgi:AraC family transcriptional activator FtrA